VRAEAVRQLLNARDGLFAALRDDVRRAELLGERNAVRPAAEQDDLLGPEPARGDDAAQPDRPVTDNGHRLAWPDAGSERGVMTRAHHVRQRQQRRHHRVVLLNREHHKRSISLRDADGFALSTIDVVPAVSAAVQA
jgi:hypothetical protein